MRIDVTQDHIDRGIRKTCNQCPVALATIETIGDTTLRISHHEVYSGISGKNLAILPENVSEWIRNFDRYSPDTGYKPEPFSFEVNL